MARSSARDWTSILSFIALICVGIALIISFAFGGGDVTNALNVIAYALAFIVVIAISFNYARSKRHWGWTAAWAVAATLVVLFYILGMI